ncbi:MAG: DPP IV N-terminal domain-containing protein, partial [Saprospiraceae bacterium]|nr:DPP IV N-terminal domain-containing protein [Saprospiraceae bacterium]
TLSDAVLYFSVSGDGRTLAHDRHTAAGKDIFVLDLETGRSRSVIVNPGKDAGPSWSPDGTRLVFYSDRDGNEELFVAELESGQVRQITTRDEYSSYNPVWSPDADLIVYYLEKGDSKDQIYLTDAQGSFHTNLTNDDHHNIFPSWTPDGRILYTRDRGQIMVMDADGTNKTPLAPDHIAGLIRMDPTGTKALVSDGESNLHILHLDDLSLKRVVSRDTFKQSP